MNHAGARQRHDTSRQNYPQRHRQNRTAEAHIQKARRQRTRPCAGAGNGNANEQQQRQKRAATPGSGGESFPRPFPLRQEKPADPADMWLVRPPVQHLPGKKVDERHRQHIADDAQDQGREIGKPHAHRHGNRQPQLHQRYHGYKKNQDIFPQHFIT